VAEFTVGSLLVSIGMVLLKLAMIESECLLSTPVGQECTRLEAGELTFVIGDVHGQLEKLIALLRGAGLMGNDLSWAGKHAALWFMGDFFDRGPDGVGVVDLVMRLQAEATAAGGQVASLLGNHEVMLLAARCFGRKTMPGSRQTFRALWEDAGGEASDLARLTPEHVAWLTQLPAMARVGDALFVHANSTFYTAYGTSPEAVNTAIREVLQGDGVAAWEKLIEDFRTRGSFNDARPDGKANAMMFLKRFGGQRIVHGHVPIYVLADLVPREIKGPLVYAGGRCIDLDGGMSSGGPGFVYQLSRLEEVQ
jgi:Calcineurin-like phosphoesterase